MAVLSGDLAALRQLRASGVDVDTLDRFGQTSIMLAAMHGQVRIVE